MESCDVSLHSIWPNILGHVRKMWWYTHMGWRYSENSQITLTSYRSFYLGRRWLIMKPDIWILKESIMLLYYIVHGASKVPSFKGLLIIIISQRNFSFGSQCSLCVCAFVLMGAISLLDVDPLDKKERCHLINPDSKHTMDKLPHQYFFRKFCW